MGTVRYTKTNNELPVDMVGNTDTEKFYLWAKRNSKFKLFSSTFAGMKYHMCEYLVNKDFTSMLLLIM